MRALSFIRLPIMRLHIDAYVTKKRAEELEFDGEKRKCLFKIFNVKHVCRSD